MNAADRALFDAALARLLDGEPEPGDGERLAQAMRADPKALREVTGLLAVEELLRQNAEISEDEFAETFAARLGASGDERFVQQVRSSLPNTSSFWRRHGWPLAAVATIAALLAVFAFRSSPAPQTDVATMLLAEKCEWEGAGPVQEGRRLAAGPLRLRQGLAVLRFDGGAELIMRGASEVELQSAAQARLVRGEVTVRAPEEAAGFKLLTPARELIDLGTEFAVKVEPSGATELHVIEGEVAVNPGAAHARRGEVLPAGKAVRFDQADAAVPHEVPMRADRFEEIVRSARPGARAELMLAYEGFAYPPGRLPLAEGKAGLGWRGSWRTATEGEAYREGEEPVSDLSIVGDNAALPWPLPAGPPGKLEIPTGTRSIVRALARPIALDRDGVTYFSFVVREPDLASDLNPRQYAGVRLIFRSSTTSSGDLLSFGPSRLRKPAIRTGDGRNFPGPTPIARDQTTLWIGKIIARRQGDDEIFFSVYGERDTFGFTEPATWQAASRGVRREGRLDLVLISTQLSAPCAVDELRIGPTWRSIAPMQRLAEDPR